MTKSETQKVLDKIHKGGGILYPFRKGYANLAALLETLPPEAWRQNESVLGGLVLLLVKQGQVARAKSYLRARKFEFEKTYRFAFLELLVALHLGERVSQRDLTSWRRLERELPLQEPLLLGLYYNAMMVILVRTGDLGAARSVGQQAISCFREDGHLYLEHFIHVHLADLDVVEGRLRRALRGIASAERCLAQSGVSYGNEAQLIEVVRLAIAYERGEFSKVCQSTTRLRESLLQGDSWSELFFQLARISVLSHYFSDGLKPAQHEMELLYADYARRHAGLATTIDVISAMIWRLEWNPGEAEQSVEALDGIELNSALGDMLLAEQRVLMYREDCVQTTTPRAQIIADLQRAQSSRGKHRRYALERAFKLAFNEGQIAPFLENRDALLGMSSQIAAMPALRKNRRMLRFTNKILKAVEQSYVIPESLRQIGFSKRQFRVAAALQSGATNKQVARQLGTTEATVKYHLTSLYRLTGATNRSEFIDFIQKNEINAN
ncbi:MAG: LuxR C-terminal-related transcriptional regulator [Paracoccaceae bacterium]